MSTLYHSKAITSFVFIPFMLYFSGMQYVLNRTQQIIHTARYLEVFMLPGVYTAQKKDGSTYYRSNITYRNKHISLGSYSTEQLAHLAYQEAMVLLTTPTITLDTLETAASNLLFEKKISLLNFRDNHIYFKNPIYLKQNYFLYFIAPHDELKFDADDLFYYSSHKIMRRKGHLFVSDYGMQVNILSRYGIKNFAVCGKDYRFVNSDTTDFRYSNIEIINKYYGVSRISRKNQTLYKVKLNIIGTHVIGEYSSEILAAVAYNKAVDLARAHGITKNYTTNYIIELSPREYADTYTQVSVSPKFLAYLKETPH